MKFNTVRLICAASMASMAVTLPAIGQPILAAGSPPPAASLPARDPIALPGDVLPPTVGMSLAPPRPPGQRPPEVRPIVAGPSLEMAIEAAQAALARCQADNLVVGVAVSDSLGGVVVGLQMTGANPGRIFFAARKNLTAIEFALPTSGVREKLRAKDFDVLTRVKPNMVVFPGAVPLLDAGGKVIGAIGVSGATAEQDEVCAAAGAAVAKGK